MKQKKIIGLIGGMSFESTAVYYTLINKIYQKQVGGLASPRILLSSLDMQKVSDLQHSGHWNALRSLLCEAAADLAFRANFLAICTNTMHVFAQDVACFAGLEVLDIRQAVVKEVQAQGFKTVALLGTRFTMVEPFYREYLEENAISVIVPDEEDIEHIHRLIYDELCKGIIRPVSEAIVQFVIRKLAERGAEAVILGCTELPMLVQRAVVPLLDTTTLHAKAIVDKALNG